MPKRGRRAQRKEKITEDWCFVCKDGGELIICDHKKCCKAYHADCVENDESSLANESRWICNWHSCYVCHLPSYYRCYCCPKAVCEPCFRVEPFVSVKGKNGMCNECLQLAIVAEKNENGNSAGENVVDFNSRETFEGLFKEYYEIVKEKEGLSLEVLRAARTQLIMDVDSDAEDAKDAKDAEDSDRDEDTASDCGNTDGSEGIDPRHEMEESKGEGSSNRRKRKSQKMEFVGWCSSALLKFLNDIGSDTSKRLTEWDVKKIINEYIKDRKLVDPNKKRKVNCDGHLQSLFRRRTVNRSSIWDMLESHFTQEEYKPKLSADEDEDVPVACEKQKVVDTEEAPPKKEMTDSVPQQKLPAVVAENSKSVPQSTFAAVIAENIKLVYLKRSLVSDLWKQPDTLKDKVTGSFVRVRLGGKEKKPFQLMQVTGIKMAEDGEKNAKMVLLVSEPPKEISVNELSNDELTEEDCEDLKMRVKAGIVERPTVVELEQKARTLHTDITKHWIATELRLLQSRIDRAHEKGWKHEQSKNMERKALLQSSAEQERLLGVVPSVIPDIEDFNEDITDEKKDEGGSSQPTLFSVPADKSVTALLNYYSYKF